MNKLKAFRAKHKLTQRALAKRLGKSLRQIQYLEADTYKITDSLKMQLNYLDKEMAQAVIVD